MDAWIAKDNDHVADYLSGTIDKPGGAKRCTSTPDTCSGITDMEVDAGAPPVALGVLAAADEAEHLRDGFSDNGTDDGTDDGTDGGTDGTDGGGALSPRRVTGCVDLTFKCTDAGALGGFVQRLNLNRLCTGAAGEDAGGGGGGKGEASL